MSEIRIRDLFAAAIAGARIVKEGKPTQIGMNQFSKEVFLLADALAAAREGHHNDGRLRPKLADTAPAPPRIEIKQQD